MIARGGIKPKKSLTRFPLRMYTVIPPIGAEPEWGLGFPDTEGEGAGEADAMSRADAAPPSNAVTVEIANREDISRIFLGSSHWAERSAPRPANRSGLGGLGF
jgi:hypothetical protein